MATNKKLKEFKIALQIIFICNPFSMCLFNLVAPAKAAAFAHKKEFSPLMGEVYGFLSYWLPWRWKKYWMAYEDLSGYHFEDQVKYFVQMSPVAETLSKMSDPARDVLWLITTEYPKRENTYSLGNSTDSLWFKCRRQLDTRKVINAFVENVWRLKDEQVEYLLKTKNLQAFSVYLQHGPIRYEQVKLLAHAAVFGSPTLSLSIEDRCEENCREFLGILTDYVKKHGTKTDLLSYITGLDAKEASNNVKQAVNAALKVHEQCVFVSSNRDSENADACRIFCDNNPEICVEAQMRMSLKQYDMYHSTGHLLQADAIAYFIRKGNIDMCRKIFVNEPENGFINEEIAHLIHANREVQTLFYQILQELEKKK